MDMRFHYIDQNNQDRFNVHSFVQFAIDHADSDQDLKEIQSEIQKHLDYKNKPSDWIDIILNNEKITNKTKGTL